MPLRALFAIWRFLPSLRYCDDFDMDSRFQQETEFIKNTLYTIKTNCMNNEVKNLTISQLFYALWRSTLHLYHVITALPTLSIEGAMHFSEGVYRSLDMLKNSTLDPEEIEYEFDRRILSVKRASLVEEKEYDALDQHHYMMDDVVEGQIRCLPRFSLVLMTFNRVIKTQYSIRWSSRRHRYPRTHSLWSTWKRLSRDGF